MDFETIEKIANRIFPLPLKFFRINPDVARCYLAPREDVRF